MFTLRKITIPLALIIGLAAAGLVLAVGPDPTQHQIYQAAQAGQLGQAEQMLNQVLADHPRSGEAHWVAAEVYARAGDVARARAELATAQTLEPGLPFLRNRAAVGELEAQLSQGRGAQRGPYTAADGNGARRSGSPWGLILVGLSVAVIIWSVARRRRQLAMGSGQYPGQPYPGQPMGMPPGGVVPPMGGAPYGYGGGPGSGLMGSLGTGLAMGAGVAAGEALVGRVLGGGQGGGIIPPANAGESIAPPPDVNGDMGGQDFGVSGDSWDGGGGGADFGTGGGDGGGGGGDWT
ncbi:MAG: tetratricopeptide repeat protein [Steroidobacteraceae bacterium]